MAEGFTIGVVGAFDVQNFGDLLFPLVARTELERRLGPVELVPFSYRPMGSGEWPYSVASLADFGAAVGDLDLLLVGGGDLIRGDANVAPGYRPTDTRTPHPFGLWLVPTLVAGAAGVPVVWNSVGVLPTLSPSLAPLLEAAVGAVAHLAVRDDYSARNLCDR
ncbi:MAG: hypothetical protein QOG30_2330, partial [Acidimicrobiaceae bacterium]